MAGNLLVNNVGPVTSSGIFVSARISSSEHKHFPCAKIHWHVVRKTNTVTTLSAGVTIFNVSATNWPALTPLTECSAGCMHVPLKRKQEVIWSRCKNAAVASDAAACGTCRAVTASVHQRDETGNKNESGFPMKHYTEPFFTSDKKPRSCLPRVHRQIRCRHKLRYCLQAYSQNVFSRCR